MATFQLGAIVTAIKGSIGGTTFRKNNSSLIMQNKPSGSSRNKLLRNGALAYLGFIFTSWSYLDSETQNAWNDLALTVQFPDKFGNLKYLSGRQLYIKLYSQNYAISNVAPDPLTASTVIDPFEITFFEYNTGSRNALITITQTGSTPQTYQLMSEFAVGALRSPTFIQRKVQMTLATGDLALKNVTDIIFNDYPLFTEANGFRVYVTAINASGFKSPMQQRVLAIDVE